jgi:hypothetical protein
MKFGQRRCPIYTTTFGGAHGEAQVQHPDVARRVCRSPRQSLESPLGEGGSELHHWALATRTFRAVHGMEGGETGLDDDHTCSWSANIGATIMGRNMFGPLRGPWSDDAWTGWWGDDPPFHTPVFVLTHHPREPVEMMGGTKFLLRHRRHRVGARAGPRGGRRPGRVPRWRRRRGPAVPPRGSGR